MSRSESANATSRIRAWRLLSRQAGIGRGGPVRAAPRIDVESAAARIAREHFPRDGRTALQEVDEDALDALLVETGVVAEGHEVAQQAGPVDAGAAIGHLHAGPVGLAGDRAVGLQQVRD